MLRNSLSVTKPPVTKLGRVTKLAAPQTREVIRNNAGGAVAAGPSGELGGWGPKFSGPTEGGLCSYPEGGVAAIELGPAAGQGRSVAHPLRGRAVVQFNSDRINLSHAAAV